METEKKAALAAEAAKIRKDSGIPIRGIAQVVGVPQGTVNTIERGGSSLSTLEAYVSLLKELGVDGVRREYAKQQGTAEIDTVQQVKDAVAAARPKKARTVQTAFSKEIQAFRRRTDMTISEFADTMGISQNTVFGYLYRGAVPWKERLIDMRAKMAAYDGDGARFTPKPAPTPAPAPKSAPAPKPPDDPKPPADPKPAPAPQPSIKLVVDNGNSKRLNNGENIAPFLKLDGTTMHVFTLVPGGVFISYVGVETENR